MALVTSKEILLKAKTNGYAVTACNVENLEMAQAVIEAAELENSPVILQTTPGTLKSASVNVFAGMIIPLAQSASVPIVLHLDHGDSFSLAVQAMHAGYTSVMIDGSHSDFETNIKLTKSVVDVAHSINLPVEAELGVVGGKEDGLDGGSGGYTDPEKAKIFVEQTGVSSLAIAIGTAHGPYIKQPKLDFQLLKEINNMLTVPLVLHGASGISDEDIRTSIKNGICKVNLATQLRIQYTKGVTEYLANNPKNIDPKNFGKAGKSEVTAFVRAAMKVCGSSGKA